MRYAYGQKERRLFHGLRFCGDFLDFVVSFHGSRSPSQWAEACLLRRPPTLFSRVWVLSSCCSAPSQSSSWTGTLGRFGVHHATRATWASAFRSAPGQQSTRSVAATHLVCAIERVMRARIDARKGLRNQIAIAPSLPTTGEGPRCSVARLVLALQRWSSVPIPCTHPPALNGRPCLAEIRESNAGDGGKPLP